MPPPIVIGIAGGSGAGKSWFARRIVDRFPDLATLVEQDWYYRDLSHLDPAEADEVNFDHPDAIEFDLLLRHLEELNEGQPVAAPGYRYRTHHRVPGEHPLTPKPLLIVEGLFSLHHPALREVFDIKVFIETDEGLRLERRLKRDVTQRAYSESEIRLSWERKAEPMFNRFVAPSARHADFIWNPLGDRAFESAFLADLRSRLARNGIQANQFDQGPS